jgi:hypothetical protein
MFVGRMDQGYDRPVVLDVQTRLIPLQLLVLGVLMQAAL